VLAIGIMGCDSIVLQLSLLPVWGRHMQAKLQCCVGCLQVYWSQFAVMVIWGQREWHWLLVGLGSSQDIICVIVMILLFLGWDSAGLGNVAIFHMLVFDASMFNVQLGAVLEVGVALVAIGFGCSINCNAMECQIAAAIASVLMLQIAMEILSRSIFDGGAWVQ